MKNQKFICSASAFNKVVIVTLSFLALWAGALVYIHLRSSEPLFVKWLEAGGLERLLLKRELPFIHLPDWLVYSLPSSFWCFSYSILITGIWWRSNSWIKYFWLSTLLLLVFGWEILQLSNLIPGTFSFGDILAGLTGATIGMFIGINIIKLKYHEKEFV